jgi:hypothetical protein
MPKQKKLDHESNESVCRFCKLVFKRESTLAKHLCKKKKRFLDRELPHIRLAFIAYQKFMNFNYNKTPTDEQFRNSPHYEFFVRFGKYVEDVKAIDPPSFMYFCIKQGAGLSIDKWGTDAVYETYVRHRTMNESPQDAAERTIRLMYQWSVDTGNDYKDFFRLITTTLATNWIKLGRISPWMLYGTESG